VDLISRFWWIGLLLLRPWVFAAAIAFVAGGVLTLENNRVATYMAAARDVALAMWPDIQEGGQKLGGAAQKAFKENVMEDDY
jgi:hypothetical protein